MGLESRDRTVQDVAMPHQGAHHETVAVEFWNGVSRGDSDAIRRTLAPDIRWHSYGMGDLSGTFVGADAVLDLMASAGDVVDSLEGNIIDIYTSSRGAIIRYMVEAHRGARKLHAEHLCILEIREDRIWEAINSSQDQEASDAFWQAQS